MFFSHQAIVSEHRITRERKQKEGQGAVLEYALHIPLKIWSHKPTMTEK